LRLPSAGLVLLALVPPPGSLAQAQGQPVPPPAAAGQAPAAVDVPAAGEIRISAESQGREKGHYWARGFVDLRSGEMRLQADALDLYEDQQPDGKVKRRIVAEGNVVFLQGDERLAGERMSMDADTGKGTFEKASGYVQPGVFVEAESIERLDPKTYKVHGGKFTSCSQPTPRWGLAASDATVHVEDKIVMRNVLFRVKGVPALYSPLLYYPIRDDQRSTGFLFPHFGNSSTRGFDVGAGFFWAMGRSLDQTFYFDRFSKTGFGAGHELRWKLQSPSSGTLRSYVFEPSAPGADYDYDLDWKALQYLPGRIKASASVRWFSTTTFQQNYQDSLNLASSRSRKSSLSLQRTLFKGALLQGIADANEVFFGTRTRTNAHLPTVRLTQAAQELGHTGIILSYDTRGDVLQRKVVREDGVETRNDKYARFDVAPTLSRPFSLSFLQVDPRASYRFTRYQDSIAEDGSVTGTPLNRDFFEGSIEARGPAFSRVFVSGGQPKLKHVIGPEFTWTYRTAVDGFDVIPKFDGLDQFLGTNQIEYALVNSVLVKRPGPAGKLAPTELLSWRVGQTYYVQIGEGQNDFDPNYSSGAFGPGGVPSHYSPLQSRFMLRPTARSSLAFDTEYDVNFKQFRTFTLSGNLRSPRADLLAAWTRSKQVSEVAAERVTVGDTLRATARFQVLPNHLTLDGGADYNILEKTVVSSRARLRYDIQCCGFVVEMIRYDYNDRQEQQFRFSLQLANIGSVGSFLGGDGVSPSGGGASMFQ
jgi:LPS-assembly protein